MLSDFATRISGSSDLYSHSGRQPHASINFVTSHDGFTLADLVSYNDKHNEANGEDNRDGDPNNLSWNCGVEGPTDDPAIVGLRQRQRRNFLLTLFVSLGVPMLSGGDEVGRTQARQQQRLLPGFRTHVDALGRAARRATVLRLRPAAHRPARVAARPPAADVSERPETGGRRRALAASGRTGDGRGGLGGQRAAGLGVLLDGGAIPETDAHGRPIVGDTLLILFNGGEADVRFVMPRHKGSRWERIIDTADPDGRVRKVDGGTGRRVHGRSAAVFKHT